MAATACEFEPFSLRDVGQDRRERRARRSYDMFLQTDVNCVWLSELGRRSKGWSQEWVRALKGCSPQRRVKVTCRAEERLRTQGHVV